jgi:shikimate kinase/3-dehydroquinate synthase
MKNNSNIVLTGFMGTGKSTVGKVIADQLVRQFFDTDEEIEHKENMPIPQIFESYGETYFREVEKKVCKDLASRKNSVVATGGGMPVDPENRRVLNSAGVVICLRSSAPEILSRVKSGSGRPMLQDTDVDLRVAELLKKREPAYAALPYHVDTTDLSVDEVAQRVLRIVNSSDGALRFLSVQTQGSSGYTIGLGPGLLDRLGELARDRGLTTRIAVVTDTNVGPQYLKRAMESLEAAGFKPFSCTVPAGEESKNQDELHELYNAFLVNGLDRRGAVVALGGGVIGDLAGYAAATYMRGVALIQCPTTLLAMVDSSVGGKTGIDLPQGKNLVGAFKQPVVVAADISTLGTLPEEQVRVGMAELIKHAVIDDADLFAVLEESEEQAALDQDLVARSVRVKIKVVEEDPFESGRRAVLNLGHTVGHALEKVSNFGMAHGDAVAIGLVAAARISSHLGLCNDTVPGRVEALLQRVGLPIRHDMDPTELARVMITDKKVVEGRVRFVLIREIGSVEHGWEVPPEVLEEVLQGLRETY